MNIPDLSSPYWFIIGTLILFTVIIGRYFLIAGLFYVFFYRWRPEKWKNRKLNNKNYKHGQFASEVKWSTVTAFIFALAGAFTIILWQKGYTRVYEDFNAFHWTYLPCSLFLSMLLHETYYYWLHRWMHKPAIFRIMHKVHHDSNITSPWTAFSFHPLEGILQAIFLPLLMLVLPLHPSIIILQLTLMTFSSVINHLDIEIYPEKFHRHILGKWLIGATHHSLHHRQFKFNYGLYFTIWDKLKKTESPIYEEIFEAKTSKIESPTNDNITLNPGDALS